METLCRQDLGSPSQRRLRFSFDPQFRQLASVAAQQTVPPRKRLPTSESQPP
jgi:hypothetical protein